MTGSMLRFMKKPALMSCIIGFVSQQIFAGWQCPGQGCNPLDSGSLSWRDIESQRPLFPVADGMKFRIVSALAYTDSSEQSPPLSAVLPSAVCRTVCLYIG